MDLIMLIGIVMAGAVAAIVIGLGICIVVALVLFLRNLWCVARDAWQEIGRA